MNPEDFWSDFKRQLLRQKTEQPLFSSWLEGFKLLGCKKEQNENIFCFQASSDLHQNWFQKNISQSFLQSLSQNFKGEFKIQLQISDSLPFSQKNSYFPAKIPPNKSLPFNPLYTFKNFIPGKNSEMAFAACFKLAQSQKALDHINPLFIYSPSGLGKTHLLNAIGQKHLQLQPNKKVIYISAERFMNDFISALRNKKIQLFRQKFRKKCDLLLMDDIQILSRGKEIQEEFFNTFNELYNHGKQVVVCCDQDPDSIPQLQERIKTRLAGGLVVEITYPDKETRLAILKDKLEKERLFLSEKSLNLINQSYKRSIREMEGLIKTIKFMTEMNEGSLPFEKIEKSLKSLKKNLCIEEIQRVCAGFFHLETEELKSSSRKKQVLKARQVAMFLIRKVLKKTYQETSLAFGKKDHSTCINAIKKVEKLMLENKEFKKEVEFLHKELLN